MRLVMIFMLLFSSYLTLITSRPSLLQEENDSEIGGEYENDESVDDEYAPEEREPAVDEVPQEITNRDGDIQDSEELIQDTRLNSNKHIDNNREEKFTESEMNIRKDTNKNNAYDLSYRDERFSFVKDHPNYKFGTNNAAETEGSKSSRIDYHQKNGIEYRNADEKSKQLSFDKSQDLLFKRFNDHVKEDKFDYVNANERSNLKKQYDNNKSLENKPANNYDYLYFSDRNRRQVKSLEEKPVTVINKIKNENTNLDIVNENIIKNIKKLSEQDLEDLMNSLPEDKKALLKKIMDKREITKKDGAVEDSSYLDQSDVSNIEGTFLVNTNPVSSLASNSDTTEANKHIESGGSLNTKVSDTENESGKSGSKSKEINDTSTTEELSEASDAASKEEANINSNNKESLKSENKREINQQYFTNENIPLDNSENFDSKNSNDFPINESSENEDWFEPKNEEIIAEQREVSQGDPSDLSAPVEKLEDSFPNANTYRETESELEPLIRIKRKEIQHKITKRDRPFLANDNVSFITDFDSEGSENKEGYEFNYKASLYSEPNYLKKGVQGVGQHFMNNKQLRKKRALSSGESLKKSKTSVNKTVKLNGTSRTISHKANEVINNSTSENLMAASKYRVDEAFGSFPLNSEKDLNRYKRIKRVKNVSNSSVINIII